MAELCESDIDIMSAMGIGLTSSRFIQVKGRDIEDIIIDTDEDSVLNMYRLAEEGKIPYAQNIKLRSCANCDIDFFGDKLILFLKEYYPDKVANFESSVDPVKIYSLMCIDFT
ncbi:MAG: hypothetical protein Q4F95_00565 [Oscillospiraceae bacterium]|nr:hypothetical protein [Oscillospiraceae bacterium]